MKTGEFLLATRIKTEALDAWVASGWLIPHHGEGGSFSEIDLARAQLIRDLQHMGVNDDAMPIILDLIDQVHGLRRAMRLLARQGRGTN